MWVLACYLPVMVGKYVQTDDEYWDNYLTLLHITDYVFAPEITIDEVEDFNRRAPESFYC